MSGLARGWAFAPTEPPKETGVFWTGGRLWRLSFCGRVDRRAGWLGWPGGGRLWRRLAIGDCGSANTRWRGWLALALLRAAVNLVLAQTVGGAFNGPDDGSFDALQIE